MKQWLLLKYFLTFFSSEYSANRDFSEANRPAWKPLFLSTWPIFIDYRYQKQNGDESAKALRTILFPSVGDRRDKSELTL